MSAAEATGRPPAYKDLIEGGLGLICMHDLDGVLMWVNAAIADLLEYDRDDMVGHSLADFLLDSADLDPYLDIVRAEGETQGRVDAQTRGGEARYLQFHNRVVTAENGSRCVVGHAQDVTALITSEAELRAAKEKLDRVLSSSPAIICSTEPHPDYLVTYVSPNVTDVTGHSPEAFRLPGFWIDRTHPDDRPQVLKELGRLHESGTHVQECRFLHADETYRWMRVTQRLVRDEGGEPIEISGHWMDLSESRRLSDEVDRFFRVSLDLLCIRGVDGYFKRLNPAFSEVLGYPQEELLSQPIQSFLHPDDVQSTHQLLSRLAPSSEPLTFEDRWRCADGSYRWFAWRAIPYLTEGLIYAVARDVTEDRAYEAELRRATNAADEANRAKSEFLANMSHEIRTPMNGVIGMTELTLETNLTDQQREYLQMVQNSAGALLDTINSILDFSKIEAGKMELEAIDFALWETVTAPLKALAVTARSKRVELLYDEGLDVPERVRGDPGRLRQALTNLVGNAVKFTHAGSVRLMVERVESDEPGIHLRFEVADTGIGIPTGKLEHIFGSFQQVDGSMTRRFGGTGLGLSITSGIVELMGGQLDVKSEEDLGSTFAFIAGFEEASAVPDRQQTDGSLEGLRALVVDDHESNRVILSSFASRLGIEVMQAGSGREALDLLDQEYRAGRSADIALLDCHMPEMDGFELAEHIRGDARFKDLLMVAVTAAGRPGDGVRCQELGIVSYLLKPLAPLELRDALLMSLAESPANLETRGLVTRHSLREARHTLHVLVAEDNVVNQQLAIHTLMRFGHTVRLAISGVEVLQALDQEAFDVILMDIQMPEMDGVEATKEIRRREAEVDDGDHIPIVAVTAHALVGDRERFLAAGMDNYISKPMGKDRLQEVLRGISPRTTRGEAEPGSMAPENAHEAPDESKVLTRRAGPERSFDRNVFMKRTEWDLDLVRTLVSIFESDWQNLIAKIDVALANEDASALEHAAHKLKGSVAVFGAGRSRELAALLERLGGEGRVVEARGEYGPLRDATGLLVEDLLAMVADLDGSSVGG